MALTLNAIHGQPSITAVATKMADAHFSSNIDSPDAHDLANATDRISAEVEFLLAQSPYRELRKMKVTVSKDEIELRGTVSSFYLKQVAQEIARKVASDKHIRNLLQVGS